MTGHIAPVNGLRFAMEHYLKHPEMITLLSNETLHRGRYVSKAKSLKRMSSPALEQIEAILRKGVEAGSCVPTSSRCSSISRPLR
jgi:hypothetical protein